MSGRLTIPRPLATGGVRQLKQDVGMAGLAEGARAGEITTTQRIEAAWIALELLLDVHAIGAQHLLAIVAAWPIGSAARR